MSKVKSAGSGNKTNGDEQQIIIIEQFANRFPPKAVVFTGGYSRKPTSGMSLIEESESEIEENAQKDRIASLASYLNGRDQKMIEQ